MRSRDNGGKWSEAEKVGPQQGWVWHNQYGKVIELHPGTVLVGGGGSVDGSNPREWHTGCYISHDFGKTWRDRVTIAVGLDDEKDICRLPDGRYLAMIRDGSNTKRLWKCFSRDPLVHWSPIESTPVYGHCPALLTLPNGAVLVFHRRVHPELSPGLDVSFSTDFGVEWHDGGSLYTGANWDCSYPSPVLLPSGEIFCAYYTSFVNGNSDIEGVGFTVKISTV